MARPTHAGWWWLWTSGYWEAVKVYQHSRHELRCWRVSDSKRWPIADWADWQWGPEIIEPSMPPEASSSGAESAVSV